MALNYTNVRFFWRGDSGRKLTSTDYDKIYDIGPRAAAGDVTFTANKPTLQTIATSFPALQVTGSSIAELVAASPSGAKGTIMVWVNHNRPASGSFQILESDTGTAAERVQLSVDVDGDVNVRGRGTLVNVPALAYQANGTFKRWFYAITFDTNVLKVWRGDVQGNFARIVNEVSYTPATITDDLFFGTPAAGGSQHAAALLDVITSNDVISDIDIEATYYGTIPIFQQTGYAGSFVDKYRQKVQAEPSSTYDTTLEAEVLADWSTEL